MKKKFEIRDYISYQRYTTVMAENEEEAEIIAEQSEDWNETEITTDEREVIKL